MKPQRRMSTSTLAFLGLTTLLAWSGPVVPHAQARRGSSMEQANKTVARRANDELFSIANLAAISEYFLPDHVVHTPRGDRPGSEDIRRLVSALRSAFPDLHATVEDQIAEGDKVVTRYTLHGTQKGEIRDTPFGTIAPTGKEATWSVIVINRLVNGKIAESWPMPDLLSFYQQLGVIPQAPPAAARP